MTSDATALLIAGAVGSTALIIAGALLVACLRRASAATRYATWTSTFIAALLLPASAALLPSWQAPSNRVLGRVLLVEHSIRSRGSPSRHDVSTAGSEVVSYPRLVEPRDAKADDSPSSSAIWLVLWSAGFGIALTRITLDHRCARLLVRSAHAVTPEIDVVFRQCRAELAPISAKIGMIDLAVVPFMHGFVRPVVILPSDAVSWDRHRLRVVILHELAHVKRRDSWTTVVAQVTTAVYWFNPLVWMAARRARSEMEQACDDAVLLTGVRPDRYATQLLQLAQSAGGMQQHALAMTGRSGLERRIAGIVDERRRRRISMSAVALVTALMLLVQAAVASARQCVGVKVASAISPSVIAPSPVPSSPSREREAPPQRADTVEAKRPVQATAVLPGASSVASTDSEHADGVTLLRVATLPGVCGRDVPDEITFIRTQLIDTEDCRHGDALISVAKRNGRVVEVHSTVGDVSDSESTAGDPTKVVALLKLVPQLDARSAAHAVQAAALVAGGAAASGLAAIAQDASLASEPRRMAVTWLDIVEGPRAADVLRTIARDARTELSVREQALIALDDHSVPVALEIAKTDDDVRARRMALHRAAMHLTPAQLLAFYPQFTEESLQREITDRIAVSRDSASIAALITLIERESASPSREPKLQRLLRAIR